MTKAISGGILAISPVQTQESMLSVEDLVNDMQSGCKPRAEWKIGIEHEQFLYNLRSGKPLPYDGAPGILQILNDLKNRFLWSGVEVNDRLVELRRNGASITLEPGGQIEISSAPLRTMTEVIKQTNQYHHDLEEVTQNLGVGILARGFHPEWTRADIPWMPKERYAIMGPYMAARSNHGVDMMVRTCGAQVNLDFESEIDMVKKYRVALGLQPLITAVMANSSRVEGRESGYKSYRSFIWTETDPDRCGVPPFVFDQSMSFERYVDYALDIPMYFIMRGGHHVNVAGQSFRDFMKGQLKGHEGVSPTIDDWHDHLTTLFPEVRLKSYLEFRGPDSGPKEKVYAMAAFWTGIFYDSSALDAACDLIRGWTASDHVQIRNTVPKMGLKTPVPGNGTLDDILGPAMDIAKTGLRSVEPDALPVLVF